MAMSTPSSSRASKMARVCSSASTISRSVTSSTRRRSKAPKMAREGAKAVCPVMGLCRGTRRRCPGFEVLGADIARRRESRGQPVGHRDQIIPAGLGHQLAGHRHHEEPHTSQRGDEVVGVQSSLVWDDPPAHQDFTTAQKGHHPGRVHHGLQMGMNSRAAMALASWSVGAPLLAAGWPGCH